MRALLLSLLSFCLLCASAWGGFGLRRRLGDRHLSEANLQSVSLVSSLLVTFTALVLSLLLASVKNSFDTADRDRRLYAAGLAQLDRCMSHAGPALAGARGELHAYTAAVIASTWPEEPPPTGVAYPDTSHMPRVGETPALAALMSGIADALARYAPADSYGQAVATACRQSLAAVQDRRWAVIEDAHGGVSLPFALIVQFWLVLVFVSFGLRGARNAFSAVAIGIGALAISSVIFVILDLDRAYGGLFGISSNAMRQALAVMLR